MVDNSSPQLVALANIGLLYDYIIASRLICNYGVYVENVTAWRLLPTHVRKVIDGIKVLKKLNLAGRNTD